MWLPQVAGAENRVESSNPLTWTLRHTSAHRQNPRRDGKCDILIADKRQGWPSPWLASLTLLWQNNGRIDMGITTLKMR